MYYILDVLTIVVLFIVFSLLHTKLASVKFKSKLTEKFGSAIAFYRLAYNLVSIVSLYLLYELSPKPNVVIYDFQQPFDIIVLFPQLSALAGIIWAFKYICVKEFLGFSQINRYIQGRYSTELDEEMTLTIEGPYKYIRHPIYFFTIIFMMFRPTMDLFYLTFFVCIVAYFYIGSIFEEKKLVRHFGDIYVTYQQSVPRIFPDLPVKPYDTKKLADI